MSVLWNLYVVKSEKNTFSFCFQTDFLIFFVANIWLQARAFVQVLQENLLLQNETPEFLKITKHVEVLSVVSFMVLGTIYCNFDSEN